MRWISFEIVRRSHSTGEEDMHLEVRSRGERRRTLRGSSWLTTTTVHRTLGTAPFQILYYCITTYVHVSHSFLNYSPYYSLNDERQWQRTVSAECGVAVRAIHTIMSHDDDLHHHWQALVLAMASCTDNFLVGLCTGVAHRPLSAKVLWGIATGNATGSLVAAAAGGAFASVVASTGYIQYSLAAVAFGCLAWKEYQQLPNLSSSRNIQPQQVAASLSLALPMTLNNLAVGVAAGVVGVSAVTASLYALVISVLTMWIGHRIGLLWHGSSNRRREKDTIGTSSSTPLYLSILLYSLLIMQSVYDAVTAGSS